VLGAGASCGYFSPSGHVRVPAISLVQVAGPHSAGGGFIHSRSRGSRTRPAVAEEGPPLPYQATGGSEVQWWGKSSLTVGGV
jgi:hypothetical protein